jgi:hypothetical protein
MRFSESGRITFKAILSLAFIAAVIYSSIKIIPVYVNDYQLNDYIYNQTPFWVTQHSPEEAILKNVLAKAEALDIPLAAEDVTIDASASKVAVNIDYHVPVDLRVYTLQLHFTHSNQNRSI